jgi:hypothetical protein
MRIYAGHTFLQAGHYCLASHGNPSHLPTYSHMAYRGKQCAYNLTLASIHETIVAVESNNCNIFWVCIYSLTHPKRNAHAPYCHLCPVRRYNIFLLYLITWSLEKKKSRTLKYVLIFSTYYFLKHFSFWKELSEIWSKKYICLHVKCRLLLLDV